MRSLKPGDRIYYSGRYFESYWGVPLVVHQVHSYYLSAVMPDGYHTTWLDFTDVILDEQGDDQCAA